MKFFNLWYKCLDVQDDFHAELRKGNNPHNYEDIDEYVLDREDDDSCDTFQSGDELDGYNHDRITIGTQVGKLQKAMLNKMESIEIVMRVSGWFNKLCYTVRPVGKDYINSDWKGGNFNQKCRHVGGIATLHSHFKEVILKHKCSNFSK